MPKGQLRNVILSEEDFHLYRKESVLIPVRQFHCCTGISLTKGTNRSKLE